MRRLRRSPFEQKISVCGSMPNVVSPSAQSDVWSPSTDVHTRKQTVRPGKTNSVNYGSSFKTNAVVFYAAVSRSLSRKPRISGERYRHYCQRLLDQNPVQFQRRHFSRSSQTKLLGYGQRPRVQIRQGSLRFIKPAYTLSKHCLLTIQSVYFEHLPTSPVSWMWCPPG